MTNTLTRSQARTWTLSAQIASAVCVLGAVALGIVGLPAPKPGVALEQARANAWPSTVPGASGGDQNTAASGTDTTSGDIDTEGLAQRFALLDNAPVPVNNAGPAEGQTQDQTPDEPLDDGLIVKRVRYIGFINDPENRHAFIRIDGKQRIVPLGGIARSGDEQFPDLTVERITPQHIILSDGDTRAAVSLAAKSGQSVTMVTGDQVQVAAQAGADSDSLLTPEEEASIAALPPRQQPMARRRLEREKRGLSPENERRRPTPEPLVSVRGSLRTNGERPTRTERDNRNGRDE